MISIRLWQPLLALISRFGISNGDDEDTRLRKSLLVGTTIMVSVAALLWGLIYLYFDEPLAAAIPLFYTFFSVIYLVAFGLSRHFEFFRFAQFSLSLTLPFLLMLALGGYVNGSAVILWAFIAPLSAILGGQWRQATSQFLGFIALLIIAGLLQPYLRTENNLPFDAIIAFFVVNLGAVSSIALAVLVYFVKQKDLSIELMRKNRELEHAYLQQEIMLRQSEKLATLGRLSAGMAHELNNPASAAQQVAEQWRDEICQFQFVCHTQPAGRDWAGGGQEGHASTLPPLSRVSGAMGQACTATRGMVSCIPLQLHAMIGESGMPSSARRSSRTGNLRWLTGARQSMRSWARVVESYDDAPDPYKGFFDALPSRGGAFPYAVLTPRYEGFLKREQEKLVCCPDSSLYILQSKGGQVTPTTFHLRDIHYVELGTFLLKSWINVRGLSSHGLLATAFSFNTVSERLFGPILDKVRAASPQAAHPDLNAERAKLRDIAGLSLKLLNYGKSSILPGERVRGAICQPEIQAEWLSLFGRRLSRTISAAHLSILTDREAIIIRDDPSKDSKYGAIRTYIPQERIRSVSLDEKKDGLLVVSLHLPENDQIDLLYSASNGRELERFLQQVRGALSGADPKLRSRGAAL